MTNLGLKAAEKMQPKSGRLDILLHDDDMRYKVGLMLGKVDASNIIRTLEYWDILPLTDRPSIRTIGRMETKNRRSFLLRLLRRSARRRATSLSFRRSQGVIRKA